MDQHLVLSHGNVLKCPRFVAGSAPLNSPIVKVDFVKIHKSLQLLSLHSPLWAKEKHLSVQPKVEEKVSDYM